MTDNTPQIDVPAVLLHFGGAVNLARLCRVHGFDLQYEAIKKWRQRRTIPDGWRPVLERLGDAIGKPIKVRA